LLLLIPLVLLTAPIFWLQTRAPEAPVSQAVWGLVVLSALANVIVIAYHYLLPAHPKFLMVPWRRFILRVHILSGTVELVSGLIACFTGNTTAALIMGAAGLFFHVPSAFLQTPIVFGSKAIMVPSYLICILTHAFCAGMLLVRPASTQWAVNTFLVFNVYVWCRIYYYLFDMLKLFGGVKYSIAILAAGATMIPALFGAMGIILLGTFIGAFILLYRLIFIRTPAEYLDFVREKARDSATGNSHLQLSGGRGLASGESDRLARSCFDRLARGISGRLERVAVIQCLAPWGLPAPAIEAYADRLLTAGPLDFPVFQRELWSIGAVRQHLVASHYIEQAGTDREKAELVFRHLDADGDGAVDAADIDLLLLEWGLPHSETRRYLARCRADASGRINFGEFLRSMEPVWRYIYHEVFRAEYAERTTEMIGRSAKAVLETRHTGRLRERVKRELLSRVPFLAGGGEELIADLAASLVTERHAVGGVICREGEPGENFHLIASGLVRVSKHGEALTDLGPGGCLGEGSLLTDLPRSATATVLQDTVLFSLTRAAFNYLTETYPHIRAQLRALHDDRRIGTNTRSLEQQLASHLPFLGCQPDPSLVADLARQLVPAFCRQGEYLLREGEPGDRFYIVEHGTLQVSCGGEILATLGTGACLGEGSLLEPGLRRASAKALADCTLLALDRQVFQEILAKYPAVRSSIADLHQRRTNPRLPVSHSHPSA
jgi:CRP-like cAMP-binding protein